MVAANSSRIPRVPLYLGTPTRDGPAFAYGAITRYGRLFQTVPLTVRFVTLHRPCVTGMWLPRPPLRNARMLARRRFGLVRVRSPLLPESLLFSSPVGTEMVHFPTFASPNLWIQSGDRQAFTWRGFPIRTFPDHRSRATPRDFSQLTTSFIAAISQGIHRQP